MFIYPSTQRDAIGPGHTDRVPLPKHHQVSAGNKHSKGYLCKSSLLLPEDAIPGCQTPPEQDRPPRLPQPWSEGPQWEAASHQTAKSKRVY